MTRDRISLWFVTCSYVGYLPFVPGTYASVLACGIVYFFPVFRNPIIIALLTAAAIFSTNSIRGAEKDPGYIVIDELIGMLITTVGQSLTVWNLMRGFILFRAFDILKPYPIKKLERLPGAYGIIADDVLAGVFANIALILWGRLL